MGIGVAVELIKEPFYRVLDKILRDVGLLDFPPPPTGRRGATPEIRSRPWHEVLGVPKDASAQEIRAAYKERVQKLHPDKIAHMAEELIEHAGRLTQRLNEAKEEGLARAGR